MINFTKYRNLANGKVEMLKIINHLENDYKNELQNEGRFVNVGKIYRPKDLQRYDIITSMVCGTYHPCMVYKTDKDYVYGVCFSSTEAAHNLYTFTKSRMFTGSFMTNTLVRQTHEDALAHFVGIFDNRAEADLAFVKLKQFYKNLFKL